MYEFIGNQFKKPNGVGGRLISFIMKKLNKPAYANILPLLEIKPGDKLLEIGYGPGIGIEAVCKNYDCTVTGVDFSELMYIEAQKRNRKHIENKKVELNLGNYLDFDFKEECFSGIYFTNVIYFWDSLQEPFSKLYKELKPNGTLCFYMAKREELNKIKFTKDHIFNKYTIDFVTEELKAVGFNNIDFNYENGYYVKCGK